MKINKTFEKFLGGAMFAVVGYCAFSNLKSTIKADMEFVENASTEVKSKDAKRYKRIVESINAGKVVNNSELWKKEVKLMRDSLYIDSIAKTNYAKGAQMVRDSIKNLSKIK